jgi:hypothetical protein
MANIPKNLNDIVLSKEGVISKHSYADLITAIDTRLSNVMGEQNKTISDLNKKLDTVLSDVRTNAVKADDMRARLKRRADLDASKWGNCKCSGSGQPTKPGGEYTYNCDKKQGVSHYWEKDQCPDGHRATCGWGDLYQYKCSLKKSDDSYWLNAPLDNSPVDPEGTPAEFATFVAAEEVVNPLISPTNDPLDIELFKSKSILLADQNGNLSTISCESTLIQLYNKIKEAQETFATNSVDLTKKSSTAKQITNSLSARIKESLENDTGTASVTVRPNDYTNYFIQSEGFITRPKDLRYRGPYGF